MGSHKKNSKEIYLLIPFIVFFVMKIVNDLINARGMNGFFWNNNGFNCFGLNPGIIKDRFYQVFIVNFQWIFLVTICLFLLKILYERLFLKNRILLRSSKYLVFILPFAAYLFFNFIFITYAHPRYISALLFLEIMLFYLAISQLVKQNKFRIIILLAILLLNLISIFKTLDPITLAVYKDRQFNFGKHKMVHMGRNPLNGMLFHDDSILYNGQFIFIDLLLNKFNKEYNITENDNVLFSDERWDIGFDQYGGEEFNENGYTIYIDNISKKRTFRTKHSFVPTAYYKIANDIFKYDLLPDKGYYLSFMWSATDRSNLSKLKQIYNVLNEKVIESSGYTLNVYEIQKKN